MKQVQLPEDLDLVQWKMKIACEALYDALQDPYAVDRYLKYLSVKNEERKIQSLKDLGWRVVSCS